MQKLNADLAELTLLDKMTIEISHSKIICKHEETCIHDQPFLLKATKHVIIHLATQRHVLGCVKNCHFVQSYECMQKSC